MTNHYIIEFTAHLHGLDPIRMRTYASVAMVASISPQDILDTIVNWAQIHVGKEYNRVPAADSIHFHLISLVHTS